MSFKMEELLKGKKFEDQSPEIQENLTKLLEMANKLREEWGKPMVCTSGLRTWDDMLRIYKDKGITDESKIPHKSKHLFGQALDISDPILAITSWLKSNPDIMEELDIYCEAGNKNWLHAQIVPFGSYRPGGTRWFNP